jgi:hypothetical protein
MSSRTGRRLFGGGAAIRTGFELLAAMNPI